MAAQSSLEMHRPSVTAEWICNTCGKATLNPIFEGMRGMESHMWVVCHFKGGIAGSTWITRRYCPECAQATCDALNIKEEK